MNVDVLTSSRGYFCTDRVVKVLEECGVNNYKDMEFHDQTEVDLLDDKKLVIYSGDQAKEITVPENMLQDIKNLIKLIKESDELRLYTISVDNDQTNRRYYIFTLIDVSEDTCGSHSIERSTMAICYIETKNNVTNSCGVIV